MSDRAAFLAHIADHPDADLPRLVFADWLDERGDPLGEFIRAQVELEPIRDRLDDERTQELVAREDELLTEHRVEWSGGWNLRFVRGLPDRVRMDWRDFAGFCDPLLDRWPTIRTVSTKPVNLTEMPASGAPLDRLREVHVEGWPESELVEEIIRSPNWNPATVLRVVRRHWNDELLVPLVQRCEALLKRVEIVQPFPLPHSLGRSYMFLNENLVVAVRNLNASLGRDLITLIRPYERRYPLLGQVGGGFYAGRLKSGAPTLIGISSRRRRVAFCTFNGEGHVDKSLWEDTSDPPWTLDRIRERFGFELGFIRVREFEANNQLAVRFWGTPARAAFTGGRPEELPGLFDHLADPAQFFVGFERQELAVSYRTGKAAPLAPSGVGA